MASTIFISQDSKSPISSLYPSRVLEGGTPGETILKRMYADFFRTAGLEEQASRMESVSPGEEHAEFETMIEDIIRESRGNLVVSGDDTLRLPPVTLTSLRGKSKRPLQDFYDRMERHIERALLYAVKIDASIREGLLAVTTPISSSGALPRIVYLYNPSRNLKGNEEQSGYSKALFTGFRVVLEGDSKPKVLGKKPDIFTPVFQRVVSRLKPTDESPSTSPPSAVSSTLPSATVPPEGMTGTEGTKITKGDTSDIPFIDAIQRTLHLTIPSPESAEIQPLPSLGAPPMTYAEWLQILKYAFQTSRGELLYNYPTMILPTLADDGVVKPAEMLGELLGSERAVSAPQADLRVFRDEAPEEAIQGKAGALPPREDVPDVANPYAFHSYFRLKGGHIPLITVA